jgi:hypothetical protein
MARVRSAHDGPHQVGVLDRREEELDARRARARGDDERGSAGDGAAGEVEEVGLLPERQLAVGVVAVGRALAGEEEDVRLVD